MNNKRVKSLRAKFYNLFSLNSLKEKGLFRRFKKDYLNKKQIICQLKIIK